MTTYQILWRDESGYWQEVHGGRVDSSSPSRALRSLELRAGTYVAVPLRSWKPLPLKVEQTTKVTIG